MTYSSIAAHGSMVFDDLRNDLYARAIRARTTADSVVLDLGAGLGIHGLVAAAAGARKVYLVEPEPVLRVAMEVAQANGLADRVVALEGRIEDVTLPEQVDMIVSVLTGNLLYSEDLLPSLFHARDRWLKPGGHLIPDQAELLLAPVSAPAMHQRFVSRWSDLTQELDYSAARRFAGNEMLWLRREDIQAERLTPAMPLASLDLHHAANADCRGAVQGKIAMAGECHGLLGWIRIRLGDQWLSSDPDGPSVHWSPVFLPFDPALPLEEGEKVEIELNRPHRGDWTWTLRAGQGTRRQSSFLARIDGLERFRRVAAQSRPQLSERGQSTLAVLAGLSRGMSNHETALELVRSEGSTVRNLEAALALVQEVAKRYAA